MRWELIRVRRMPRWPLWAVAIVALWGTVAITTIYLHHLTGQTGSLCWFHRVTGLPCPTCGLTRGLIALYHGHWLKPWTLNPLLFTLLVIIGMKLLVRLVTGYTIRIHPSRRQATTGWAMFFVVFFANWTYLIFAGV